MQVFSLSSPICAVRRTFIRAESSYAIAVLCPLTLSSGMEGRVSVDRSTLFVLSAPHIQFRALFPQRASAYQFLLFFLSACTPANSISFVLRRRVSACQSVSFVLRHRVSACRSVSFVLGGQAQADAVLLCPSAPRKRIPIRFLCPRRASASRYCTSLSSGIHSRMHQPKPR